MTSIDTHSEIEKLPGLRTYLSRVFLFATLFIGAMLFYLSFNSQIEQFEHEQKASYQRIQKLLLTAAEDAIIAEDLSLLSSIIKELGEGDPSIALLQISNDEGRVIAEWKSVRTETSDVLRLTPAVVQVKGRAQGSIVLNADLSHQRAKIRAFVLKESILASLMLLLLLALQLYLVNKIAIIPIRNIEERLIKVAEGDLSGRLKADGASEFAQLSNALNTVTETLYQQKLSEAQARAELESLNSAYVRFVPETFLNLLGKEHIVSVQLGDHTRSKLTIMFTDIRSFTPLAEKMTAEETFKFINDYFAHLGPIVRQYHGVIDKYIGDAIMALFVSPNDAIDAGIAMLETLADFNAQRVGEDPIKMGIGLHTGEVMLGTIGERFRMEGTVIGDVVNLASRLESLTKNYEKPILISEVTKLEAEHNTEAGQNDNYVVAFVDEVLAKGKSTPTRVYSVEAQPQHAERIKESISGIRESISGVKSGISIPS